MVRLPDYEKIGRKKIFKDCNIKRHRIVAFAFTKSGMIITHETNRLGSGIVSDFSWHAEEFLADKLKKIAAINRYGDIHVLVTRLGRAKGWTMAKPCDGCQRKLRLSGVVSVFYTEDNGNIVEMKP